MKTYSSMSSEFEFCNCKPNCKNFGAHSANAPVTNATHVNPPVDNMKLRLKYLLIS